MSRYGFPKSQKLKSRKQLQLVFGKGKRVQDGQVRALYLAGKDGGGVQCGVGLSGRYFKRAVDRNRIKRQLREAYRLQQEDLQSLAQQKNIAFSVFILYLGREMPLYHDLYAQVGVVLQKIINQHHAPVAPHT
ncbi:MAG: ribonuclease P protein component [Niabella sp.]